MNKLSTVFKLLVKVVISIAFFSVLLSFVKTNELAEVFENVNILYMVITIGVTVVMLLASCAKWKVVLDLKNRDNSFSELLKIYLVGYFFSNILPSTVGGDVVRSYYAGKLIDNQSFSAVSIFVERFSGILFLFLLVGVAPLFQPHLYTNPYVFIPAIAGFCFAGVTLWVWRAKNPFALPNKIAESFFSVVQNIVEKTGIAALINVVNSGQGLYHKIIDRLKGLRQELTVATGAIKEDRSFLIKLVYLTVFFYLLTWINVYTCFKAFNVDVDFIKICAIVPAIMLVAYLPVTLLGNLGYFESVFVFYFLMVGVGGAEALAMSLLLRLKMLAMGIVGYFTYLIYKQKNQLILRKDDSAGEI